MGQFTNGNAVKVLDEYGKILYYIYVGEYTIDGGGKLSMCLRVAETRDPFFTSGYTYIDLIDSDLLRDVPDDEAKWIKNISVG